MFRFLLLTCLFAWLAQTEGSPFWRFFTKQDGQVSCWSGRGNRPRTTTLSPSSDYGSDVDDYEYDDYGESENARASNRNKKRRQRNRGNQNNKKSLKNKQRLAKKKANKNGRKAKKDKRNQAT